jgi:hypothetical protein
MANVTKRILQKIFFQTYSHSLLTVVDKASYNCRKMEKFPTESWKKNVMREWFMIYTIPLPYEDNMLTMI